MTAGVALVTAGILQAVLYLLFVRFIDLYEREALRYVVPVFVWGFTVAAVASLFFNTLSAITLSEVASAEAAQFLTAVFVAPFVEEIAKGLAVFVVFVVAYLAARRRGVNEFSGVMDGIVYGSAVGFGFSIAEDLLYYAQAGPDTFVVRRVFGGFAHAAFTSLIGVGLGLVTWVSSYFLKLLLPVLGLGGAMFLHGSFNLVASLFGPLAYVLLFFVLLIYAVLIVVWLWVERRVIRSELRDEVGESITAEEYEILPTYFRRTAYYTKLLLTGRIRSWRRAHLVHSAAIDLAFTKRLERISYAGPQAFRLQYLRDRIGELRSAENAGYAPLKP